MSKINAFLLMYELSVQILYPFLYWVICLPVLCMFLWVVLWVLLALACLFFSWYFECVCVQSNLSYIHICMYMCIYPPYFLHGFWICVLEKDSSLLHWNFSSLFILVLWLFPPFLCYILIHLSSVLVWAAWLPECCNTIY